MGTQYSCPLPSSQSKNRALMSQIDRLRVQQRPVNQSHMKHSSPRGPRPPLGPGPVLPTHTRAGPSEPLWGRKYSKGCWGSWTQWSQNCHPERLLRQVAEGHRILGISLDECVPRFQVACGLSVQSSFWGHCRVQELRTDSDRPSLSRVSASQRDSFILTCSFRYSARANRF